MCTDASGFFHIHQIIAKNISTAVSFLLQGKAGEGKHMARVTISRLLTLLLLLRGTDTNYIVIRSMSRSELKTGKFLLPSTSNSQAAKHDKDFEDTCTVILLSDVMGEVVVHAGSFLVLQSTTVTEKAQPGGRSRVLDWAWRSPCLQS